MKTILTLLLLFLTGTSNAEVLRLSEPVQQDETSETFGEIINLLPPPNQIADLLEHSGFYEGQSVSVAATVKTSLTDQPIYSLWQNLCTR